MLSRRTLLSLLAGAASAFSSGRSGNASNPPAIERFDPEMLSEKVRQLAKEPYIPPAEIPEEWTNIDYDQYRLIRPDPDQAIWSGTDASARLDLMPPGLYFPQPVKIFLVEEGEVRELSFDMGRFLRSPEFPELPEDDRLGPSGVRYRAELAEPGIFTEFFVAQGASYFRGIAKGERYGLSARGLAIDTAEPSGEEFPDFTEFWLEKPHRETDAMRFWAVMDSESVAGLYEFTLHPGEIFDMSVRAELYPRRELNHIGLGALTSMYLFDANAGQRFDDFRPAVHDSDGLLMFNGAGEEIWRPLANPSTLQISAFLDDNPKGFGLMQRKREYDDFADLEALYHLRPSLWITPKENWGKGSVTLVEIPAPREIYDNIVAYWRPNEALLPEKRYDFSWDMRWAQYAAPDTQLARVISSRQGLNWEKDRRLFVIDFSLIPDAPPPVQLELVLRSSAGELSAGVVQKNEETGGYRLAFTFDPTGATLAEFRAQLRYQEEPLSEVWLYRWTA